MFRAKGEGISSWLVYFFACENQYRILKFTWMEGIHDQIAVYDICQMST